MRQLGLLMNTTAFSPIHEATDPEVKVSVFTSIIRSILDKAVPLMRVSITNNDKPWMTVQIKKLIKERQHAFCCGDKAAYRNLQLTIVK